MSKISLISCGSEIYRRYLVEELASSHSVTLFTDEPADWAEPFMANIVHVNPHDENALYDAVKVTPTDLSSAANQLSGAWPGGKVQVSGLVVDDTSRIA